jgi:hypothetical protein
MRGILMQGWTTVRGVGTTVQQIVQGEDQWLDLAPYQDCAFWIDCRETSIGTTQTLNIDTAPARDESLFASMVSIASLVAAPTPVVKPALLLLASTTVPLARWVRWRLSSNAGASVAWDATFRIWVAANVPIQ